jgi:hypothetical protein
MSTQKTDQIMMFLIILIVAAVVGVLALSLEHMNQLDTNIFETIDVIQLVK